MDNKILNQYLKEFYDIRNNILKGNSTWKEAYNLRNKYNLPKISLDSFRRGVYIYDEFNNAGWIQEPKNNVYSDILNNNYEESEILSNGNISSNKIISISNKDISNPDKLLEAHGFDKNNFELIQAKNTQWNCGKNGEIRYSSKITIKPKNEFFDEEYLNKLKDIIKNINTLNQNNYKGFKNYSDNGKSLLYCLFDCHYGRYCWEEETGNAYNLEIADKRINNMINELIKKIENKKIKEIVLPIGNDFINSSANGFTTSGKNKQDNCAVFRAFFSSAIKVLIESIDNLKNIAPVKIILVEGNHGKIEEWMLGQIVQAYYKDDKQVFCDVSAYPRKYHIFGNSVMGFCHGSEEGNKIYSLMQNEVPGYWAMCDYRYWFIGHYHSYKMKEEQGVEVWTIPSITNDDAWTVNKGYISKKRSVAFIFDEKNGMEETYYIYDKN